jgi:hypothetical protein
VSSGSSSATQIREISQDRCDCGEPKNVCAQGTSFVTLVVTAHKYSLFMVQTAVADMRQQSARSQTTSCLTYSIAVERMKTSTPFTVLGNGTQDRNQLGNHLGNHGNGNGTYWRMCAIDGDKLYLRHHVVSISAFPAHAELPLRKIWVSGQPFLLMWMMDATPTLRMKPTSLLHSGTSIVCIMSGCRVLPRRW